MLQVGLDEPRSRTREIRGPGLFGTRSVGDRYGGLLTCRAEILIFGGCKYVCAYHAGSQVLIALENPGHKTALMATDPSVFRRETCVCVRVVADGYVAALRRNDINDPLGFPVCHWFRLAVYICPNETDGPLVGAVQYLLTPRW